ncbi:hypothetical protein FS749_000187 [Ceratobasidium sp. UAMH 11750]|nr:hypothetical protein FS749_000187 [Ceratobasidium sp. UAMH 11750]
MPPLSLTGIVTKAGYMKKTVTVTVTRYIEHPKTHKLIARSKKYLTHDPQNELKEGDKCIIRNCPPVSARKRFVLESIVKPTESLRLLEQT